ncbi:MAG: flavodoxin family protein [Ilumatobacteraceae bacterium]
MKAALLVESLTGHTWKAAEAIAGNLMQEGWTISGLQALRQPDHRAIQEADVVLIGTWVHGAFIFGQAPWNIGAIRSLPAIAGKRAATFCTFAINPGRTLDVMDRTVSRLGADVVGGLALHRAKIDAHSEEFAARLCGALAG